MIYNSLDDIAHRFDLFVFDAYGVLWEGNGFYPQSRETMQRLIKQGKTIVILSNTTLLHSDAIAEYKERGLIENRDYNYLITSGDVLRNILTKGSLKFQTQAKPRRYYVIGKPHNKAFNNTIYERTLLIEEAEFVYCGVPFMTERDFTEYPQYADRFLPAKLGKDGKVKYWDTLTVAPFENIVEQIAARNIPILNANSDLVAKEGHPLASGKRPAEFVIRNGTIAQMFRERGIEVLELGKPHKEIYEFSFALLAEKGVKIQKDRCCMVGDTIRTDIKGAVNAGITPVLCVETGITAEEISLGNSVESLCLNENINVQQIVQIKSVGGV